jgi:hypothetical protein
MGTLRKLFHELATFVRESIEISLRFSLALDKPVEQKSLLQDGIHSVAGLIWREDESNPGAKKSTTRAEVEHYAGEFLKTVPLFMPIAGKAFTAATYSAAAVLQGLDQVKSGDKAETQALDFGMGLAKGALTKGSFDTLGRLNFAKANTLADIGLMPKAVAGVPLELTAKAFSFGISSRVIDSTLTKETYQDKSGNFSLTDAAKNVVGSTVSPGMLATDLAVFAGSPLLLKGVSVLARGALERSIVAQTAATGGSFGLLSGALGEAQRQYQANESFDAGSILARGFVQGAVTAAAAIPGGLKTQSLFSTEKHAANDTSITPVIETSLQPYAANQTNAAAASGGPAIRTNINGTDMLNAFDRHVDPKNPLESQKYREVAESSPRQAGAKKYESEGGLPFWQMSDGRIFYELPKHAPKMAHANIWAPPGSSQPSVRLNEWGREHTASVLDESRGIYRRLDGSPEGGYEPRYRLDPESKRVKDLGVTDRVLDDLTIFQRPFEPDWRAGLRIVPTANGEPYYRARLEFRDNEDKTTSAVRDARVYTLLGEPDTAKMLDSLSKVQSGEKKQIEHVDSMQSLLAGSVRVVVTEAYGRRLDALREVRKTATLNPQMFPELKDRIYEARREMFLSPHRDKLLPEHLGQYYERTPYPELTRTILLLEHPSRVYAGTEFTADAHFKERMVRIFGKNASIDADFELVNNHEWSHFLHAKEPALLKVYTAAKAYESFVARSYGDKNSHEHWTVNTGELFLNSDPEAFMLLASEAPVKTVITAKAIQQSLDRFSTALPEHIREALEKRVQFVDQNVLPVARYRLETAIGFGAPGLSIPAISFARELFKNDPALFKKLVDINEFEKYAVRYHSDQKLDAAMRTLVALDALKEMKPESSEQHAKRYATALRVTRAANTAALRDQSQREGAIDGIRALHESNPQLYKQTVRFDDLEFAAKHNKKAFDFLLSVHEEYPLGFRALTRMAAANSATAGDATAAVLRTTDDYKIVRANDALKDRLSVRDSKRFPYATVRQLAEDAQSARHADPEDVHSNVVGLVKASMLKRIIDADPVPDSLQNMETLVPDLDGWIERSRSFIESGLSSSVKIETQRSVLGPLQTLATTRDPVLQDLARSLVSEQSLRQLLLQRTARNSEQFSKEIQQAVSIYSRLYPEKAGTFVVELMQRNPSAVPELIRPALFVESIEAMSDITKIVERHAPQLSPKHRTEALDMLAARIERAATEPELKYSWADATRLRIRMAQALMQPLSMELFGDLRQRLDAAIDLFHKKNGN